MHLDSIKIKDKRETHTASLLIGFSVSHPLISLSESNRMWLRVLWTSKESNSPNFLLPYPMKASSYDTH